jgi:hypothetical protein
MDSRGETGRIDFGQFQRPRKISFGFCMGASSGWHMVTSPLVKWLAQHPIRTEMPSIMFPNMAAAVKPHPAPPASTLEDPENCISEIDGLCSVESCTLLKPTSGADNYDVHRLGLAETRAAVFHLSSFAWTNAYSECCDRWLQFLATCAEHQVDFLTGDGITSEEFQER